MGWPHPSVFGVSHFQRDTPVAGTLDTSLLKLGDTLLCKQTHKTYELTSVLSERPLLKNISDTAIYLIVTSGLRGPVTIATHTIAKV